MSSNPAHLKTTWAATLIALLLALTVVVGCGDEESPEPTGGGSAQSQPSTTEKPDSGQPDKKLGQAEQRDSGGGSQQFRVENTDNAIVDFGAEGSAEDFEEAAATLHRFLDARAAEDWEAVCAQIAEETRLQLEKAAAGSDQVNDSSCETIFSAAIAANPAARSILQEEAKQADVASLRAEGSRGYVIYRARGGAFALQMTREDGRWRVAAIGGSEVGKPVPDPTP